MKLYDITFRRDGHLITWQRWARNEQEARESFQKALDWDYSAEETKIVSVEESFKRFGAVVGTQDYLCLELLG